MANLTNLLTKLKVAPSSAIIYSNINQFPASPLTGQICFKDQVLYIYSTINSVTTWYPLTNVRDNFIHTQSTASLTWNISHGLDSQDFIFIAYNDQNEVQYVSPSNVTNNSFTLTFTEPTSGKCAVFVSTETRASINLSDMFVKSNNDITVKGHLIPSQHNTFNLGSPTMRWKDFYVGANTIYLGDNTTLTGTGIHVESSLNPSSINERPTLTGSKITLKKFSYDAGLGIVNVNPTIQFDDDLTVGDGTKDVQFNCNTNKFIINASNFSVDTNGNVTFAGTPNSLSVDGGTW